VTVWLPPLRERRDDIPILAEHFLARACRDYSLPSKSLTPAARSALCAYGWPGNVRELGNVMERVALLSDGSRITPDVLELVRDASDGPAAARAPAPEGASLAARLEALDRAELQRVLEGNRWNVVRAATSLGITRGTIRYRIAKYDLRPASRPARRRRPPSAPPAKAIGAPPAKPSVTRWEDRLVALLEVSSQRFGREFDLVVEKIESFAGRIEDAGPSRILAAFGVEPIEDAPRRAALAAMAIQNALVRRHDSDAPRAEVVIVVHADRCPVADVGGRAQIDGDAKRRAAETFEALRAGATPDTVVVSDAARSLLGGRFEVGEPPSSDLRTVPGRRLVGYDQHRYGLAGRPGPFLGRDRELGVLRSRWREAVQGRGQVVAVVGEPGIGKSRLLFELGRSLGDEPHAHLEELDDR
jgi:hypothetical protein